MTLTRRRLMLALAAAPWAPLLAACSPRTPAMTAEEARFAQRLTARMRTRCIGRHLIDLPEDFVLNPVQRAEIEGVQVSIRPQERAWFDYELNHRTDKLKREKIFGKETPSLMEVRNVPGGVGRIFNRAETGAVAAHRTWELMAWQDGFQIKALLNATDTSLATRIRPNDTRQTDVEEQHTHLLNVYRRVRGRADDEIPSEPGDGFAHGFWKGGQADNAEFYVNCHLKDTPDVYIHLRSVSGDYDVARPETGLMQRRAQIERDARRSEVEILRLNPKLIQKQAMEELVAREPKDVTSARVPGHTGMLQTDQSVEGRKAPFFKMLMFNGHYIPSPPRSLEEQAKIPDLTRATLSEGQVLALWEAITATLRPRPGAF